ncbi:hypothetical protein TNCV_2049351 [Trichonephila clavipes]|nr:hypothetical protein TNCV_2049351 [Trichonephila clavipes]
MLEAETIQCLNGQRALPDDESIEHVWGQLRRRIAARPNTACHVIDLEIALVRSGTVFPKFVNSFTNTFQDGMSPIEAIRFHENKFLLEDNFMSLANASINPTL